MLQQYDEYKVIHVVEGGCGTLLLGSSGLPLKSLKQRSIWKPKTAGNWCFK